MPNPSAPPLVEEEGHVYQVKAAEGGISKRLFLILFCSQFLIIAILTIFLTIYGLLSASNFKPLNWYPPMLVSIASSGVVAFIWQWITSCNPFKAIKSAFWLSPLLTCLYGVLHIYIGSAGSLALGVIALVSALIQSLYGCWVNRRFEYATRILSVSAAFPPNKTKLFVFCSILVGILYSSFLVAGIGGATADSIKFDALFILVILLSLAWTMQVFRNVLQVTISHVKYLHFSSGSEIQLREAFRDTIKHLIGSISIGSMLVPIIGLFRGSARGMNLVVGDTDEFMFSCVDCFSGVASVLITYGNRWGFVYVGVYNKGFTQASRDTWEMFRRVGLEGLIDLDLTGVFCFFCGVVGGAIGGLVSGIWAIVVHKSYASEVSIYAFLIGYYLSRLGMAWPQACVSAYYVAYAENPESARFDATIPARLEELQRYQA